MTVPPDATSGDYKNKSAWMDSIVKIIPDLIKKNQGRTLVLFSSYSDLETVAKRIGNKVVEAVIRFLFSATGTPQAICATNFGLSRKACSSVWTPSGMASISKATR